jgi:hypothetical protein
MPTVEAPHGKTHVSRFAETIRESLGVVVQVLTAPGASPAEPERTVASVRGASAEADSVVLTGEMTVAAAEQLLLAKFGIAVRFLARDAARPAGQTQLSTIGFGDVEDRTERASVVSITGQKKISTLQREFTEHHSHLGLMLFSSAEHEKSLRGEMVYPLGGDQTIASVREKKSTEELSIHGNMLVRSLESRIREIYGLYAQVCIMTDAGKRAYTGESHDGYALSELNRRQQEKGRLPFAY